MKHRFFAIALMIGLSSSAVSAQENRLIIDRWLARQLVSGSVVMPFKLADQDRKMRNLYVVLANRLPQTINKRQRAEAPNARSRPRAQLITKFLEKDADNDGNVTTDELKLYFQPIAHMPLRANSGLEVEQTEEQADRIVEQMLQKDLIADANKDGTIDFAEMRKSAELATLDNLAGAMPQSIQDPLLVEAFDASKDKIVSQEEFLAGVAQVFAKIDADKNGVVSAEEAFPYSNRVRDNTF